MNGLDEILYSSLQKHVRIFLISLLFRPKFLAVYKLMKRDWKQMGKIQQQTVGYSINNKNFLIFLSFSFQVKYSEKNLNFFPLFCNDVVNAYL